MIGDEARPEAEQTLVECLACGGKWQIVTEDATGHRMTACRWCTRGAQSEGQAKAWRAWKERAKR